MPNYIPGEGPPDAKLIIVGEAGGAQEDEQQRPFVGPSGAILDSWLSEVGITRSEVYVTNVVKYRPPNNNFRLLSKIGIDYAKCVEELFKEIRGIRAEGGANCILALGAEALRALTGYSKIKIYRGSILSSRVDGIKVVGTIHPAAFLHSHENTFGEKVGGVDYSARAYVLLDVQRALEESKTKELNLPQRNLQIARNSHDVYKYFNYTYPHSKFPKGAGDIETLKSVVPSCISFAFSRKHSLSIPLIPGLSPNINISSNELAQIWKMVDERLSLIQLIGQNFKFDTDKLSKVGFRKPKLIRDTMLISRAMYPEFPSSQAFLTSVFTREPYYKDEYKDYDPTKQTYDTVLLYNAKDSAVDFEINEELEKEIIEEGMEEYIYDFVMPLHDLFCEIEDTGMRVDFLARRELRKKYTERLIKIQNRLDEVCDQHVNVSSPKQVAACLYQFLELPRRTHRNPKGEQILSTDEDTIISLMNNAIKAAKHEWKKGVLRDILEVRKIRKTISTYLKARVDFDGRMRCHWNIIGTETGRSSTSKLEAPDRFVPCGFPFQTATKHGEVGTDLRLMFLPDLVTYIRNEEERKLVFFQLDLSQAEARVVAVLAKQWDLLEKFKAGIDVHSELAAQINGRAWDGKRVPDDERFLGKTGRHSGNYDVQAKRFMLTVNTDAKKFGIDLEISQWKAGQILENFHALNPNVREVFHTEIREAIDRDRILKPGNGARRQFFARASEDLYREAYAYIPQNLVRWKLLKVMFAVKKEYPWVKFAVEAHDAFVICNMPEKYVQEVGAFGLAQCDIPIDMTQCTLSRDYPLVIPGDVEIGYNYKELKKAKIERMKVA